MAGNREYAEGTSVSVEKSRSEIESTLRRFGASQFLSGWDQEMAYIAFKYRDRAIQLTLTLPERGKFLRTPHRRQVRNAAEVEKAWEQACRESWRCLALMVKAKLVAVEKGVATLENEFLAYTMLPDGGTVAQWLQPQIQQMITDGCMPQRLLPAAPAATERSPL